MDRTARPEMMSQTIWALARDICLAVVWWLFHAAASSVEHRAMQLRFRKMAAQGNIKVERISRLYDELRISELLADHQVRWL